MLFKPKSTEINISSLNYQISIYSEWENDTIQYMQLVALDLLKKLKEIEDNNK